MSTPLAARMELTASTLLISPGFFIFNAKDSCNEEEDVEAE